MKIEIEIPQYEQLLAELNSLRIEGNKQNKFTIDRLIGNFNNLILLYKQTETLKIQNDFLSIQVIEVQHENFRLNERLISYYDVVPEGK